MFTQYSVSWNYSLQFLSCYSSVRKSRQVWQQRLCTKLSSYCFSTLDQGCVSDSIWIYSFTFSVDFHHVICFSQKWSILVKHNFIPSNKFKEMFVKYAQILIWQKFSTVVNHFIFLVKTSLLLKDVRN